MNSIHVLLKEWWGFKAYLKAFSLLLMLMLAGNTSVYGQCPNPGLTVTSTTVTCNGANDATISITVDDPNGYAGSYTYDIIGIPDPGPLITRTHNTTNTSHTFTGLPPAEYFAITVSMPDDGSCTLISGASQDLLAEPAPLALSATTLADCDLSGSGSIDLTVTGGTTPIVRHTWTGGLSDDEDHTGNVNAGSYDVEIEDSNGCIATLTGIVVPGPAIASINPAGPFCTNDAPVNLTATPPGGTWSGTGITDAAAGTFNPSSVVADTYTITYEVTDGNGCLISDTEDITVNAAPDATITPAGPFCVDEAPVNLVAATGGGMWSGPGITDAANGTFDPSVAGAGNHPIEYTVIVGGCESTDTEFIEVNALPDATITAAGPFCVDSAPVNLVAATGGGAWSGPGITDGATGTFDPSVAGVGTHLIEYTVSVNGCESTDTELIEVNALPDATITAAGPFCVDAAPVNLVAATGGGTWSGPGITDAANGTFDPSVAGAGNHPIEYTVVVDGCASTDTEFIEVNALPDATITPAGPFCIDSAPVNLVAATGGGAWSGTGITDGATGTFDPSVAGVGTHTIDYTVVVDGCVSSDTELIEVNALPDATITAAGPFCVDAAPVNLVAATGGGVWSGPGITDGATGTFDPSVAGVGTHTIDYTVVVDGCVSSDTELIEVNALPDATITPAGPFCIDSAPVNLVAATGGGTWSGPGITDGATGTFDPSVAGVGTHTIDYTVVVDGCVSSDTELIEVNALPDATITPAGPFCVDAAPVNLVAATGGGTWSGTGITDGATGTFDPSVAGVGPHLIEYTLAIDGCVSSDTELIEVNALPDATITAAGPFCVDSAPVNLVAATGGGTWLGPGITDAVNGTFDPSVAGVDTHTITYQVTDVNGCESTDTEDIIVHPLPDATITPAGPFCVDSAPLNLVAATGGGAWSGPGITDGATGTFDPSVAGVGTHTIDYTVVVDGCVSSDTELIEVNALPDATITAAGPFCVDAAPVNLVAATGGGVWSGPGITDGATGTFDPSVAGVGTHPIDYTVVVDGCASSDTEFIEVNDLPDATITPAGPFCVNSVAVNLIAATGGGTWSGTGITDAANGTFDPAVAGVGTYTITYQVTDVNGCTNSDTEDIEVNPLPDPGTDNIIDVCKSDNAVDLFAALGGTPQTGGTWNDDDGSGGLTGAIFDATGGGVIAGNTYNFTYTVNNAGCTPASATVSVNVIAEPNAGTGSTGTACITTTNFDLFTLLAGFDAGGTWNDDDLTLALSGANNEIFDASVVGVGSYDFTYIVTNPTCPAGATTVTVDVVANLNAGTAVANINACTNNTAFNLFTGLTGNDAGGSWNDDDATGALTGNLLDASAVAPGSYQFTYTIAAPGCTPDSETITVDVSAAPAADAGLDQSVCNSSTFLNASLGANETGVWTVLAGTGTFVNDIDPNTEVTGLTEGVNTFQWEVTDVNTNCSEVDVVDVSFTDLTVPQAGPDQTICTNVTTLAANNYDNLTEIGIWSYTGPVLPAPAFDDPTDPNTQVTGLIAGETYDFTWTIADINPFGCGANDDVVTINVIGTITAADAGPDQAICDTFTNLAANIPTGVNETGTWTVVNGTGIFADASDHATSVTGLSVGTNEFQWEITAPGPCPPSADIVIIEVSEAPIADAGPDQNICTTVTTLAGNGVGGNDGLWTVVSGTGTFIDDTDPHTQVTGLSDGNNVFRWTITDPNGICPTTQSDVTIQKSGDLTAADAGPDQTICDEFTNLAANDPTGINETGAWTVVNGTGTFTDATDHATSVTGLSVGINEFQWEITAPGPCPPSADIVIIEVSDVPTADAGPDQNICTTVTTLAGNDVQGNDGLWTVVSGTGTFIDDTDPHTQVTGLSDGNNVFRWTITDPNGICPTTQSDVTIQKSGDLTAADAGPDQTICDEFTNLAANDPTGINETGAWTVVNGTGTFTDASDHATLVTGLSPGLNEFQWEITDGTATCPPSNDIVAITVISVTTADAGTLQNICNNFTTLAANQVVGNESGMWSVVNGTGTFTAADDPETEVTGLSLGINEFRWTITDENGICTPSEDEVIINVLDPADPLCGGGGINCGAFVISVIETRPTCVDNDDGTISFDITGGSGNYTVILTNNNGFNKGETGTSAADIVFQDLTADDYEYTVDDGAGNVCTLPYSLVRETTVKATAADFVDVVCFGTATGEARITITEGGNAPYEYSIDGLVWNTLPPNRVVTNLPPLGTYNILVRDDIADQCPAEVAVTIDNAFQEIDLTFNASDATCNNAGGSIEVLSVTGGQAPYRYRLDGVDFSDLPANNTFEDLTAGFHFLTVIDDNNCEKIHDILVDAPGLVLFTSSVTNPDCNGSGQNGSITIQIDPSQLPGSFEAAISTEIDEDGEFQFVPSNGIMEFLNLSVGTYYITVVAADGCPNKVPITINGGPVALGFDLALECFDNSQAILLSNITAEDNTPFNIEVYRVGEITPIDVITLPDLPAGNIYRVSSANFLNAVGNYQLLLTQDQTVCGTSLNSGVENFNINLPLSATLGEITQSFPERGTGAIMINNITGGAEGYQILIEPSGGTWIEVPKNQTNQEFEYQFTELLPGVYEVFISDSLGCEIMFGVELPRDTEIFIPNVFTPNGDTYNDTFFIRNLPLDGTKLLITNRLGRKIYESDNYQNDWDGEENSDGVYFYTIQIGDEKYSGWIEIWRGGIGK